ncbi:MAG TPA: NifB/NifX family molybdenum-iron cluster-binding protein [Thermoplasmata archaeon]
MKVCVPTGGRGGMDDSVSEHFGRAPTFTVVDTETGIVHVVPNTSEHMGGVGKPPEQIAKTGAKVLLCSGLGPKAVAMFVSMDIAVFVGAIGSVADALKLWESGKLESATEDNACRDHHH